MAKTLSLFYLDMDGKSFGEYRVITLDESTKFMGAYYFDVGKLETGYPSRTYYPIFAVNGGSVQRAKKVNGEMVIQLQGYYMSNDIDNYWFVYCLDSDPYSSGANPNAELDNYGITLDNETNDITVSVYNSLDDLQKDKDGVYINSQDSALFDFSISTGLMSDSYLSIGSTFSPSCSITMIPNSNISVGKYIRIELGIVLYGTMRSVNLGVFYISTPPDVTSEEMTVSGVGLLDSALNKALINYQSKHYPEDVMLDFYNVSKVQDIIYETVGVPVVFDFLDYRNDKMIADWKKIRLISGFSYEEKDDGFHTTYWGLPNTFREYLSMIAVYFNCNVVERNGVVHLVQLYQDTENFMPYIYDGDYEEEPNQKMHAYFRPNHIIASAPPMNKMKSTNIYDDNNHPYVAYNTDGQNLTSDILNVDGYEEDNTIDYPVTISGEYIYRANVVRIGTWWNDIVGYRGYNARAFVEQYNDVLCRVNPYYPIDAEIIGYSPVIYAGNYINVMISGIMRGCLLGNVTLSWDGAMSMSISTPCDVEIDGNASNVSSGGISSSSGLAKIPSGFVSAVQTGKIIQDSAIKGSQIDASTFRNGQISGTAIDASTFTSGSISGTAIDTSTFVDGTINGSTIIASTMSGSVFVDGTIENAKIKNGTIENAKIKDGTIENAKIKDGTIQNAKIKDSTITGSKIADSTLTGAKIEDATIGYEKVDTSFVTNLTADNAFIDRLNASVASIGALTADSAVIKDLQSKKADIDFANVRVADVGTLLAKVGLIDRATIVEGHVTGFLDAVEVNANKITAGTLIADRILLSGSKNGLLYELNNLGELTSTNTDTLDGGVITKRTITADHIVAKSITANEIDVENLFAQNIVAKGTITGATLKGASAEIDDGVIGGFTLVDNMIFSAIGDETHTKGIMLVADEHVMPNQGGHNETVAIQVDNRNDSTDEIENSFYVCYDGYMYADYGQIGGFEIGTDGLTYATKTDKGQDIGVEIKKGQEPYINIYSGNTYRWEEVVGGEVVVHQGKTTPYTTYISTKKVSTGEVYADKIMMRKTGVLYDDNYDFTVLDYDKKLTVNSAVISGDLTVTGKAKFADTLSFEKSTSDIVLDITNNTIRAYKKGTTSHAELSINTDKLNLYAGTKLNITGTTQVYGTITAGAMQCNGTLRPGSNNSNNIGTTSYQWNNAYIKQIYENGTLLSNKYMGIGKVVRNVAISTATGNSTQIFSMNPNGKFSDFKYMEIFYVNNNGFLTSKKVAIDKITSTSFTVMLSISTDSGWEQISSFKVDYVSNTQWMGTVGMTLQRRIQSSVSGYTTSTRYINVYKVVIY